MVVFMLQKMSDVDTYREIKKMCCIDFSIPSQVLTSKPFYQNNQGRISTIISKIAAQLNCKIGGELWGVKFKVKL